MKEINKKNSVIIWTIISIILAIIYTIVCKKFQVYQNSLYIERTICVFGVIQQGVTVLFHDNLYTLLAHLNDSDGARL